MGVPRSTSQQTTTIIFLILIHYYCVHGFISHRNHNTIKLANQSKWLIGLHSITNGTCFHSFIPARIEALPEGTTQVVELNVTCERQYRYSVNLTVKDKSQISIENGSVLFLRSTDRTQVGFVSTSLFVVRALQFGRTQVEFFIDADKSLYIPPYHVAVVRAGGSTLNLAFVITLGILIVFYNIGFGCKLKKESLKKIVKRPVAPAIGFATQFLLMAPGSGNLSCLKKIYNYNDYDIS